MYDIINNDLTCLGSSVYATLETFQVCLTIYVISIYYESSQHGITIGAIDGGLGVTHVSYRI